MPYIITIPSDLKNDLKKYFANEETFKKDCLARRVRTSEVREWVNLAREGDVKYLALCAAFFMDVCRRDLALKFYNIEKEKTFAWILKLRLSILKSNSTYIALEHTSALKFIKIGLLENDASAEIIKAKYLVNLAKERSHIIVMAPLWALLGLGMIGAGIIPIVIFTMSQLYPFYLFCVASVFVGIIILAIPGETVTIVKTLDAAVKNILKEDSKNNDDTLPSYEEVLALSNSCDTLPSYEQVISFQDKYPFADEIYPNYATNQKNHSPFKRVITFTNKDYLNLENNQRYRSGLNLFDRVVEHADSGAGVYARPSA